MVATKKKVAQKPSKCVRAISKPRLVKLICTYCGATIEVTKDSECWHCGTKLVKDEKWRHKYAN